jgi:hypothetical protein
MTAAPGFRLQPPWPGGARLRAALWVVAVVFMLHTGALSLLDKAPGRGWQEQPPRLVHVRQIPARIPAPVPAPALPAALSADATLPLPRAAVPAKEPPQAAAPLAQRLPAAATPQLQPATAEPGPEARTETDPAPEPGGLQVPIYATQLPAATVLRYESRRGLAHGVADLAWQPGPDGYQLSLQGQALGAPFIGWTSVGGMDSAGLAPLRHAELRRGREARAANFQRDAGRVTFSGPQLEHSLVPGMQDRLSWLVQIPAVLQANPALAQPGAQVQLAVVGTRGDAEVWTFTVQGRGPLDLPGGPVADAVHLLREPRRPYDMQVQLWLDPARQHLPVQAWLRIRATGEGTELRLLEMSAP